MTTITVLTLLALAAVFGLWVRLELSLLHKRPVEKVRVETRSLDRTR